MKLQKLMDFRKTKAGTGNNEHFLLQLPILFAMHFHHLILSAQPVPSPVITQISMAD
jgi:hypothetical protein